MQRNSDNYFNDDNRGEWEGKVPMYLQQNGSTSINVQVGGSSPVLQLPGLSELSPDAQGRIPGLYTSAVNSDDDDYKSVIPPRRVDEPQSRSFEYRPPSNSYIRSTVAVATGGLGSPASKPVGVHPPFIRTDSGTISTTESSAVSSRRQSTASVSSSSSVGSGNNGRGELCYPSTDPQVINRQVQELGFAVMSLEEHKVSEKLAPLCTDWKQTRTELYGYNPETQVWTKQSVSRLELWLNRLIEGLILCQQRTTKDNFLRDMSKAETSDRKEAIQKDWAVKEKLFEKVLTKNNNPKWTSSVARVTIPRLLEYNELHDFDELVNNDPWIFSLRNGMVLDLNTIVDRERSREDYCTMVSGVVYNPDAPYDEWHDFVCKMMGYNMPVVQYLQEYLAYNLSGSTHLQVFSVFIGRSDGGKTSFFDVMKALFGTYAYEVPKDVYLKEKFVRIEAPSAALANTQFKRFGSTAELSAGDVFSENKIQVISTGEQCSVRAPYSKEIKTFKQSMKAHFHTNELPTLKFKEEIVKRIRYFRIRGRFVDNPDPAKPETEFKKVPNYQARFLTEEGLSGVLNWIIVGLRRFNARGKTLPPIPASMKEDVQAEVDDQDNVQPWIGQCLEIMEEYTDKDVILTSELFKSFTEYFHKNNEYTSIPIKTSVQLGKVLISLYPDRWKHTKRGNGFKGIRIRLINSFEPRHTLATI